MIVLLLSQWCQASMNAQWIDSDSQDSIESFTTDGISESLISVDGELHSCCPTESLEEGQSAQCESCGDELLTDARLMLSDASVAITNTIFERIDGFFHDALTHYWRYRETLWWGLSKPIYLLVGFFLE